MSENGDPPKLYGEREIGRILERATEIQKAESDSERASPRGGLSLHELEEIAAEAGIDPRHLRRAALEVEAGVGETSTPHWFAGSPLTLTYETVIDGQLDRDGLERMVAVIQESAGSHGQPSLVSSTLAWQYQAPTSNRSLQVVITARDGHTRIRLNERLHGLAGGLFGGIMGGGGGGIGMGVGIPVGIEVLGSALAAVVFPVGVLGIAYVTARGIFGTMVRKRERVLQNLLRRLTRAVEHELEQKQVEGAADTGRLPAG